MGALNDLAAAALSNYRRALAVQWEQWVLTSVSHDSCHAGYQICSKNYL